MSAIVRLVGAFALLLVETLWMAAFVLAAIYLRP